MHHLINCNCYCFESTLFYFFSFQNCLDFKLKLKINNIHFAVCSKCCLSGVLKNAVSLPSKWNHRTHCCHAVYFLHNSTQFPPKSLVSIHAVPVPQNVHSCWCKEAIFFLVSWAKISLSWWCLTLANLILLLQHN